VASHRLDASNRKGIECPERAQRVEGHLSPLSRPPTLRSWQAILFSGKAFPEREGQRVQRPERSARRERSRRARLRPRSLMGSHLQQEQGKPGSARVLRYPAPAQGFRRFPPACPERRRGAHPRRPRRDSPAPKTGRDRRGPLSLGGTYLIRHDAPRASLLRCMWLFSKVLKNRTDMTRDGFVGEHRQNG